MSHSFTLSPARAGRPESFPDIYYLKSHQGKILVLLALSESLSTNQKFPLTNIDYLQKKIEIQDMKTTTPFF